MKSWLTLLGLALLLTACGTTLPEADAGAENLSVYDQWIPDDIQGDDRFNFIRVLSQLPLNNRDNLVMVTADGRVLTNKKGMATNALQSTLLTMEHIGVNCYRYIQTGEEFQVMNEGLLDFEWASFGLLDPASVFVRPSLFRAPPVPAPCRPPTPC